MQHLDKIFQLKLSLPPKSHYSRTLPLEESEQRTASLISQYLQNLTKGLPASLEEFITNGFPPNPRKIKRALSLAYFIGKNIKMPTKSDVFARTFPNGFEDVFPLILICSVATTSFSSLAELIKLLIYYHTYYV
jgi:hypothetical protein